MNGFCYFIGTLVGVGGAILGFALGLYEGMKMAEAKKPQDKVTIVE